jgi:hypothetical protein
MTARSFGAALAVLRPDGVGVAGMYEQVEHGRCLRCVAGRRLRDFESDGRETLRRGLAVSGTLVFTGVRTLAARLADRESSASG